MSQTLTKRLSACCVLLAVALLSPASRAQASRPAPRLGYAFPAGGQRGETFNVLLGGQYLQGVSEVHVTGTGVGAAVVTHYRAIRNLQAEQRRELLRQMRVAFSRHLDRLPPESPLARQLRNQLSWKGRAPTPPEANPEAAGEGILPRHPLFEEISGKSLKELLHLHLEIANFRRRQPNAQIGEMLLVAVAIAQDAEPGERELRVVTPAGLSNPVRFQVGALPEVDEGEPNDPSLPFELPEESPLETPVVVNGQIMPGDVDRVRFRGTAGQPLVAMVSARTLMPFMADAVPGWFQPTLRLFGPAGTELAYADDFRNAADPVLHHVLPEDGEYVLEIRDSVYRGREDFVYRLALGELPCVTAAFPLGGRAGEPATAALSGWNLGGAPTLSYDTSGHPGENLSVLPPFPSGPANSISYQVGALPELLETEPNDTVDGAQPVELSVTVNGRIGFPGDTDLFRIRGHAGETVVAEVTARQLLSPLDALVRLRNEAGEIIAFNDDVMEKRGDLHVGLGTLTQGADPLLEAVFPVDGDYWVEITDARRHGGTDHAYRLRISAPVPDYTLYMTPSSLTIPPGRDVVFTVHALRREGFEGPIDVTLSNAPPGFEVTGGRIPPGRNSVRMTLSAPPRAVRDVFPLTLEGCAVVAGAPRRRPVHPADDVMQAFLYRHLVPAQILVGAVRGKVLPGRVRLSSPDPVSLCSGGKAEVEVRYPKGALPQNLRLQLNAPPDGVSLEGLEGTPTGFRFRLALKNDALPPGHEDNLIVEALATVNAKTKAGKEETKEVLLGALPAIPFLVAEPPSEIPASGSVNASQVPVRWRSPQECPQPRPHWGEWGKWRPGRCRPARRRTG